MKSSGVMVISESARLRWKVLSEGRISSANYAGRPSMCRNCGALVGSEETICSLCGAPKASSTTPQAQAGPPVHDGEAIRFARAILSRPYIFTIVFLIANVFVFLLTSQAGANENAAVLIRYGAKVNAYIDLQQEWWRFVTPIFLHGNIAHLLMNMYGLWVIGPYVERLYGSAKFVFFWVATGIAGVVASYLSVQPGIHSSSALGRFIFKAGDSISVGASGALFGLIGVLFVFGIKFRRELPEGFKRAFGTGMLPTILLNVAIGFMVPVIDNAAHLGGLLAGAVLAVFIGYKRPGDRSGAAVFWHFLQIVALALVVVSFVMVARNFNKSYANLAAVTPELITGNESESVVNATNEARTAFNLALVKGDGSRLESAIKSLDNAPALDKQSGDLLAALKSLLLRAKDLTAMPSDGREQKRTRALKQLELSRDFGTWAAEFSEWVKTEGKKYGIVEGQETPPSKAPPDEK